MGTKRVDRRRLLLGGAVVGSSVAMATEALAGAALKPGNWAGATGVMPGSGFFDAIKAGARADGKADDQPLLQHLLDGLTEGSVVHFPPGRYHLGKPLTIKTGHASLIGWGAFFDNTIILDARELRAVGLSVVGSPGDGFHMMGGQGAHYESLSSQHNGGVGFLVGGADGRHVAWAVFQACNALRNKGDGWLLDGSHDNNWVNATLFSGCWSRANGGCGWKSLARTNYNCWIGTQVEENCIHQPDVPPIVLAGIDHCIYGSHVVDTNNCGTSIRFLKPRGNMIFGGRYIGGVEGAEYTQAVILNAAEEQIMRTRRALRRGDAGDDAGN